MIKIDAANLVFQSALFGGQIINLSTGWTTERAICSAASAVLVCIAWAMLMKAIRKQVAA